MTDKQEKGDALEKRVVRILKRLGKRNIKQNVIITDTKGNKSEIDVMYGYIWKVYVECKNHSKPVSLADVAKFKEVLTQNGIPLSRGLFISAGTYVPRAVHTGVKTMDGVQLRRWEKSSRVVGWGRRVTAVVGLASAIAAGYQYQDDIQRFGNRVWTDKRYRDTLMTQDYWKRQAATWHKQADRWWQDNVAKRFGR